jgi:hypothetical protein
MKRNLPCLMFNIFGHLLKPNSIVLAIFMMLQSSLAIAESKQSVNPIVIQIAYMYHFMKFVEWPTGFLPQAEDSYNLCTATNNIDTGEFESISQKTVRGQPISVNLKTVADDFDGCHLVFISGLNENETKIILEKSKSQSALTVGTDSAFLDHGGMVKFHVSLGRVTFSVNLKTVLSENLSISANMLDVAERVYQ